MAAKRPIKVFIDASPLAEDKVTGIPHFTAELVRGLEEHPEHGTIFQVVLVIAIDKRKKLQKWGYKHVTYRLVPMPLRIFNLVWKWNMLPPLDILFGRGVYVFPNYKNWPLLRSKSLTYIHDLAFIRYPESVQPQNLAFLQSHIQRWVARADKIMTGSDHARQEIIELLGVAPEKVARIYHGVEAEDYYPRSTQDIAAAKNKYGVSGEYILYVGSLEPRKNLLRLLEAYLELPALLRQRWQLLLVGGGGWLNGDILDAISEAQAAGVAIIRPSKYVEDADMPAIMSGASLLALVAVYEGFGLPPLEAMACGTPVLVADNSSLPEVVGTAGFYTDATNTADIAKQLEIALTDQKLRTKYSATGRQRAKEFTWQRAASELVIVIETVVAGRTVQEATK